MCPNSETGHKERFAHRKALPIKYCLFAFRHLNIFKGGVKHAFRIKLASIYANYDESQKSCVFCSNCLVKIPSAENSEVKILLQAIKEKVKSNVLLFCLSIFYLTNDCSWWNLNPT